MDFKPTISERLDNILGIETPAEEVEVAPAGDGQGPRVPAVVSTGNPERDFNNDFEKVRQTLHNLIDKGTDLTDAANYIAKEKQDSRSIEAAAIAQKEARDNALALIDLHQKKVDIGKGGDKNSAKGDTNIQNNAVFVGTTGELLKLTRDLNNSGVLKDVLKPLTQVEEIIEVEPEKSEDS